MSNCATFVTRHLLGQLHGPKVELLRGLQGWHLYAPKPHWDLRHVGPRRGGCPEGGQVPPDVHAGRRRSRECQVSIIIQLSSLNY